jgi:hypothetical protein
MTKCTTANERFGVMAAGSPQKRQCGIESLYPAGKAVEAATTPSRHHVSSNARRHCVRTIKNGIER